MQKKISLCLYLSVPLFLVANEYPDKGIYGSLGFLYTEDEYAMASESWYQAKDPSVIKIGEDIMLAAYIAAKLGGEKFIPQLYQSIVKTCSEDLFKKHKDYFERCSNFGKLRAISS